MAPSETLWRPGPAEPTSTWRRRRPARSSSSTLAGSAFGSENATTRSLTGGFGTRPWSASVSTGGSSAAAAADSLKPAARPVPLSVTVAVGRSGSSLATASEPVNVPGASGANVTGILCVAPAARSKPAAGALNGAPAATEVTWSVCEPGFVTCTVSTWFAPTTVDVKRSVSGDRTMLGAAVTVIVAGTSSTGCTGSFVETTSVLSYVPWDRVPTSAVTARSSEPCAGTVPLPGDVASTAAPVIQLAAFTSRRCMSGTVNGWNPLKFPPQEKWTTWPRPACFTITIGFPELLVTSTVPEFAVPRSADVETLNDGLTPAVTGCAVATLHVNSPSP